jgi:hypothetical protein
MFDPPCFSLTPVTNIGHISLECTNESSRSLRNDRLSSLVVSKVKLSKIVLKLSSVIQLFYLWDRLFLASQCPYLLKIENDDYGRFSLPSYFTDCHFCYILKDYIVELDINPSYTPTIVPMGIF